MNSGPAANARALQPFAAGTALRKWVSARFEAPLGGQLTPLIRILLGGLLVLAAALTLLAAGIVGLSGAARAEDTALYVHWLGGSIDDLLAVGISCPALKQPEATRAGVNTCYYAPSGGPIAQVALTVSRGNVGELHLLPRSGALELGDLIARLGRPQTQIGARSSRLVWPRANVTAHLRATALPVSYHTPVQSIHITQPRRQGASRLAPQLAEE